MAIHCTHNTIVLAFPGQPVFDRDMLLNLKFVAKWLAFKIMKQKEVDRNNRKKHSFRVSHDYQIGDKVFIISSDIFILLYESFSSNILVVH